MTDEEIKSALKALDLRDDVDLTSWECELVDSLLYSRTEQGHVDPNRNTLTPKQREKALQILEQYEQRGGGDQETIVRGPPEVMKHLRRQS